MSFTAKVYIVQKADGTLLAVKLTHVVAHQIAKDHAPAKVTCAVADKSPDLNVGTEGHCV